MNQPDTERRRDPPLLEHAQRRVGGSPPGSAVADLLAGRSPEEVARRRGLSPAAVAGIRTFYDQLSNHPQVCDGTACHFGGRDELAEALRRSGPIAAVRCLGHCYASPAFRSGERVFAVPRHLGLDAWIAGWGEGPDEDLGPMHRTSLAERPVVLRNLIPGQVPAGLAEYDLPSGDEILDALERTRLRGRGGASFPTAAKWRAARDTPASDRWVVANGDEGDPGSFVDRLLLEEDPHAVLAGMVACARVIGARHGIAYVRAEYPRAQHAMRAAITAARAAGKLGAWFDVEVVSGAGSYVCGEETALLQSILGLRGEPRPKPPYPAQSGLHGQPTVVQNVETLAIVPWIARHGMPSGTKAISLSGAVRRPGAVEIPLGMSLRRVLQQAGGGAPEQRPWSMALIGGPLGRVLPEHLFDTALSFEALPGMGHAGIVVLDESVTPRALAEHLFAFARAESCGNCLPCRAGTGQLARVQTREGLERLLETMEMGSLCGFGQGVARPIRDLLHHYGDDVVS
jgi:NADH:ubiquinone oxidoreductase subunit F (NADH-binding)